MTVKRQPLTGDPILFAPTRAERPRAFDETQRIDRCPFCRGNEGDTPPELARIGEPWRVRVFPNKYPPVEGAEVIVESPRHDDTLERIAHIDDVLRMYVERLHAHANAPYTALFRNDGVRAGASIPHVHSQLVPLPFIPPRIARELDAFTRGCALCTLDGTIVDEGGAFVWLVPSATSMPYQQWLVPRVHAPSLGDVDLRDLASLLQRACAATRKLGDFNVVFMNFPHGSAGHFYVDILPRVTTLAGLELGTGTFVEIIDPATAAETLRR